MIAHVCCQTAATSPCAIGELQRCPKRVLIDSARLSCSPDGAWGSPASVVLRRYAPRGVHSRTAPCGDPRLRAAYVAAATSRQTIDLEDKQQSDIPAAVRRPKSLLAAQDDARALQAQVKSGSRALNPRQCNQALQDLCASGERWSLVKQVYDDFQAAGVTTDLVTYRELFTAAVKSQQGLDVVDLLRAAERQHGPVPLKVYCSLISRLLKRQGRATRAQQTAYELWRALRASGQRLDDVAFRTGMNLCVELGRLGEARQLMDAMRAAGYTPGWAAYNILMKYHTDRGDMDGARKLFAQLRAYTGDQPLDISAYNTLLAGFVRQGDLTMARAVLDKARRERAAPDAYTYSSFASGLADAGRLDEAEALLGEMEAEGVPPSSVVYGAVLDGCARLSDWSRFDRLIARMRSQGLGPTLEHFNMLLRGRCYTTPVTAHSHVPQQQHRQPPAPIGAGAGGVAAVAGGLGAGSAGGASAGGAAIAAGGGGAAAAPGVLILAGAPGGAATADAGSGTGGSQRPGYVDAILAEMRACGLRPDAVTYGTLVDAAVRRGSIEWALDVVAEMRVEGVPPDGAVYTSLMKLFREQGRQAQALEFFEQMVASRSAAVDGWALNCLVAVHASVGRMAEAEEAVRRASHWAAERGRPPPPEATYALMQGYGQLRQLRPALLSFRRFLASGGRPHRKMCEYAYRLCLSQYDFAAAGQVLRAMRLMRGLQMREELYRQKWQEAQRRFQARRGPVTGSGGGASPSGGSNAAEKWKWWFGLPNNYYSTDWR